MSFFDTTKILESAAKMAKRMDHVNRGHRGADLAMAELKDFLYKQPLDKLRVAAEFLVATAESQTSSTAQIWVSMAQVIDSVHRERGGGKQK
mgnify:CR=1 FL=1